MLTLLFLLLAGVAYAWREDRRRLRDLVNGHDGEDQRRTDQFVLLTQEHENERQRSEQDRTALLSKVKRLEDRIEEYVQGGQRMVREINQRNERISKQEDAIETLQRQRSAASQERDDWRDRCTAEGKRASAAEGRNLGLIEEVGRLQRELDASRAGTARLIETAATEREEFDRLWSEVVASNATLRAELHEIEVRCRRYLNESTLPPAERGGGTVTSVTLAAPESPGRVEGV